MIGDLVWLVNFCWGQTPHFMLWATGAAHPLAFYLNAFDSMPTN
jgi:hypothetical protein